MKKVLLLAGALLMAVGAYAQGTVNFANGAAGVNAPVSVGTAGNLASGAAYMAALYVGPANAPATSLSSAPVSGGPVAFGTGASAGYFLGGSRDITGFAPGSTVTLQVRAWNASTGATYEAATLKNFSPTIQVALGGGTIPTPNLVGLTSFTIPAAVPEPSSIALGLLGLGAVAFFRRRK